MSRFLRIGIFFSLLFSVALVAQSKKVSGVVTDANREPLPGVNIQVVGTLIGTTTDNEGVFLLKVDSYPVTLEISYVGYKTVQVTAENDNVLEVVMEQDVLEAENVVVVGSRFRPRTAITSPEPIDNIKLKDLHATAQVSLDKMLHYVVPSFNSTQQTISDATAHFDPADLRGLGPSRTLVLINGKRKNPSALVYINDTPGKGDVGVDMNSIPVSAIKRVEVLRDGASTQYGSDAIAGVINIILEDQTVATRTRSFAGITSEGDGFQFGSSINTGFSLTDNGFVNISSSYTKQNETNRAGTPGKDGLFGPIFNDPDLINGTHPFIKANPDLGMRVGLPNMETADIYFNSAVTIDENNELYSFGGVVYRTGKSYALYRTPYWIPDNYFLLHDEGTTYNGFQPTFETSIFDAQFTTGFKSQKAGWQYDLSYTYGSNSVDYTIGNTLNLDLGAQSPTQFYAGGYGFNNHVINFDMNKVFFDKLAVNVGTEFRQENFIARAGEEASYYGGGAQSFPGLQPQNAVDAKRTNIGAYLDLGFDVTENMFIGAATRVERYSDFGNSTTFKLNGRMKTSDNKYSVRASISSGFRAPSLHQIYLSNIQTLVSGGTISNQGTFNNNSPILRKLGVDKLKQEKSLNVTLGVAGRPFDGFYISADLFQINLDDRIVYSSSIASSDTNTTVGRILKDNNITSLKFFINAVNTLSQGVDIVGTYNIDMFRFNLAATFAKHSIEGKINTPSVLARDGLDIFDRKEQSRILTSRPTTKVVLGGQYTFDAFRVGANATYFGEVTWQHASDPAKDQTFSAKTLVDLNVNYKVNSALSFSLLVNNVFNVYPDVIDTKGDFVTDLGGRFKYPWEVNQFGFNGTTYYLTANINL